MGPTESMLISTSVIWFSRRRQKPCCCALHFINHIFMWTRHLTAQTWAFAVGLWIQALRLLSCPAFQMSEMSLQTVLKIISSACGLSLACQDCWRVDFLQISMSLSDGPVCVQISTCYCPSSMDPRYCDRKVFRVNHYLLPFSLINYTNIIAYLIF